MNRYRVSKLTDRKLVPITEIVADDFWPQGFYYFFFEFEKKFLREAKQTTVAMVPAGPGIYIEKI